MAVEQHPVLPVAADEVELNHPRERDAVEEVERVGFLAVGRKYGVSDNAIRKWIKAYERVRAVAEGRDPNVIEIPTRTWPNQERDDQAA